MQNPRLAAAQQAEQEQNCGQRHGATGPRNHHVGLRQRLNFRDRGLRRLGACGPDHRGFHSDLVVQNVKGAIARRAADQQRQPWRALAHGCLPGFPHFSHTGQHLGPRATARPVADALQAVFETFVTHVNSPRRATGIAQKWYEIMASSGKFDATMWRRITPLLPNRCRSERGHRPPRANPAPRPDRAPAPATA